MVGNDAGVDVGLAAGRSVSGPLQIIVNARVAIDPTTLESICRQGVASVSEQFGASVDSVSAHSLRPGRPTPTHRVSAP